MVFDADGNARATVPAGTVRRITLGLGNASTEEPATIAYSVRREGLSRVAIPDVLGASITDFGTSVHLSGTITCGGAAATSHTSL